MSENSIYRERFYSTIDHKPVDRCPIDLGGTPQSTVDDNSILTGLAQVLGLHGDPPSGYSKFDERILDMFDIDFRRTGDLVPFNTHRYKRISDTEYIDPYGVGYKFTGIYWEISSPALPRATIDDIAAYDFPEISQIPPGSQDRWKADAKALYENSPYVIAGEHPVFGVLELACWMCGYDHIMMMMALDPEFIHLLFGKILEFQKRVIKEYYTCIGSYIHLTTSGDDFGTQNGMFMSPDMWREFVKPYMEERIRYTSKFTDALYMHHSCGSIAEIIPDLAGMGVRILNPIQPNARNMEPDTLKADFGDMITFHGGLDTQEVLPSSDAVIISGAVNNLLDIMNPQRSGGYIFAAAHNLQGDVAPETVAAMYTAVHNHQKSNCPAIHIDVRTDK